MNTMQYVIVYMNIGTVALFLSWRPKHLIGGGVVGGASSVTTTKIVDGCFIMYTST